MTGQLASMDGTVRGEEPTAETGLTILQLALIGLACAVCVANNYYSQPLLADIARDLGMSEAMSGLAPTVTQLGIAAGMLLLLPLGDRIDNRRIVVILLLLQATALLAMSLTDHAAFYLGSALAAGMCGIVTYLLPAFATRLVEPERRGAVTGTLAMGIMIGIMLGRSAAGIAGYAVGWRTVYVAAALLTLLMGVAMKRVMPLTPGLRREPYALLLRSLIALAREIPLLRRAAMLQALSFGMFNALWVGLALRLQAAPFNLNTREIGLLSLVAVTGAIAAPFLGKLADRFDTATAVRACFILMASGWLAMLIWPTSYIGVVSAMVIIGVAATGSDISLRTALYGLDPAIRMRLNSVYSTATFAGGSLFSLATPLIWTHWGWSIVSLAAFLVSIGAILLVRTDSGIQKSGA